MFDGLEKRNIDSKQAIYRIAEKLCLAGEKQDKESCIKLSIKMII